MSSDTLTVLDDAVATVVPITFTKPKPRPKPIPNADVCGDRGVKLWRMFEQGAPTEQTFNFAVMTDVQFERSLTYAGCSGEYSGHAIGNLTLGVIPTQEQLAQARRLMFYPCDGFFADRYTGEILHQVSALFLFENLRAAYIP